MKTNTIKTKHNKGFTLIEMIGVLAVIAILAALLIPKVFQAITEARINTVPVACGTIKTAVIDYYAKYGGLHLNEAGTDMIPAGDDELVGYDQVLLNKGLIDKPFAPRIGANPQIILAEIPGGQAVGGPVALDDGLTYSLAGTDGTIDPGGPDEYTGGLNDVTGSHVVFATITGVPLADAQAISARIDGPGLTVPEADMTDTDDTAGRVKYAATATTIVYVYLTHR